MTDQDYKELDRLFSENERMTSALRSIALAEKQFKPLNKSQQKNALGIAIGLNACANIAKKVLKENEDGREETESRE
jgi:hypothetical protein